MHTLIGPRLSIMMFLEFFIWGSWYVTAPLYLGKIGFTPGDFGWTYGVGPIAGMLSPFFLGMIADRFFATERVLGVMHLLGAGAMYWATTLMAVPNPEPSAINLAFFLHMLCFYPTLSLTNTLALHNMTDAEKQFPLIRVFGTIGWIIAGFALDWLGWTSERSMFWLTISAATALGLYSFTLPHTPPPNKGKKASARELLGMDAFVLLKRRSFLVFIISSFLICIPLAFYYQLAAKSLQQTGVANTATKMSYGQISEIVFMLAMPLFFKRLGVKWMLLVGMACWVIRYALFAIGAPTPDPMISLMLIGIVLHGICYDFFFVTGQIYTDKAAPKEIRGQAQGMLVLFTLGIGMFIGAWIAGVVEGTFTPPEAVALNEEAKEHADDLKATSDKLDAELKDWSEEEKAQFNEWKGMAGALRDVYAAGDLDVPSVEERIDTVTELTSREVSSDIRTALDYQDSIDADAAQRDEKSMKALQLLDWQWIWTIPCIFAAIVMIVFGVLFQDDTQAAPTEEELAADTLKTTDPLPEASEPTDDAPENP
ncbi:nucleoside permease [Thalassoroseus pseudoceratinae]|uniref:nucleoside permease n=1 Tax=Thalassoroseus pseudoceratinae TaxID=2713176 RepID=UPI001424A804|nr:nucleoside permease [Thalassoroseus pseudoceratinae]